MKIWLASTKVSNGSDGDSTLSLVFILYTALSGYSKSSDLADRMQHYGPILERISEALKGNDSAKENPKQDPLEFFEKIWARERKRGVLS